MSQASKPPALDGHFFSVVVPSGADAVLQVEIGHNGWSSGCVRVWLDGKELHMARLSDLHEVAMGQRTGDASPCYHFCLLYRASAPLLLSTRTDFERRDVRARAHPLEWRTETCAHGD